jgi:PAS domain S-box-containing protein
LHLSPFPGDAGSAGVRRPLRRSEFDLFLHAPDPALDELTELAAVMTAADFAYMGWMDYNRLWFKSTFGFQASEQPRAATACQWMLETGDPLLLQDASQDPRFLPSGIRLAGLHDCLSFAGVPLITADHTLVGTFALLSHSRSRFSLEHLTFLEILGRQAVTRLELYNRIQAQERAQRINQRTELALAIERSFVSATLDAIPALVAVLDTAGRLVRLNESCAQLTGLKRSASAGVNFLTEIFAEEDREWAAGKLRDAAAGRVSGPHETTWQVAGAGGERQLRRVSWTLRPLDNPLGEIQYLILSGQDMTSQRQIEAQLHSSESRYRQVVEKSLGFVFTSDLKGRLTSLNAATAETLGCRVEDLSGHSLFELLDEESAAAFSEGLQRLHFQEEWQGALSVRRGDGVCRRIAFRSRRMALPNEPAFLIHHGMDVTEQHRAEEALRLANRQRELILESVADGIFGIDLAGRFTFVNHAAAHLLGYAPEELADAEFHSLVQHSQPDGTAMQNNPILTAMHRQQALHGSGACFWRKDRTSFPVEYNAAPLFQNGQVAGMVVAFQDASERRRLERMKDEFISTVSHELRTPLTSLRAALGLLHSGALEKRPEKRTQMIAMALDNCDRLTRLVSGIMDFENVEKGALPLRQQPLEAIDLLRRAADIAHSAAAQAHISFRISAAPLRVLGDEERLLQVIGELIENAIKFSPAETTIHLIAQSPAPTGQPAPDSGQLVEFIVEDQGRGIEPEKLEKIFARFQQGDASDSRALGGTGLGLALCRAIIEQHGGRIRAESSPGHGSRFLFTLPAAME